MNIARNVKKALYHTSNHPYHQYQGISMIPPNADTRVTDTEMHMNTHKHTHSP